MSFPLCTLCIFVVGAIGGLVNALLTDNGFFMPYKEEAGDIKIMRPGVLGNCLISGVAAFIYWGLYSSAAGIKPKDGGSGLMGVFDLTPGILAAAMLVGISGARWLTNEVDKNLLRAAATEAAKGERQLNIPEKIALATPAEALRICAEHSGSAGHKEVAPNPGPRTDSSAAA